jgi:hypothetical protein
MLFGLGFTAGNAPCTLHRGAFRRRLATPSPASTSPTAGYRIYAQERLTPNGGSDSIPGKGNPHPIRFRKHRN